LGLNNGPQINHVRPSVDVLFESIARFHGAETIAVLLTGMGEDGAAGMKAIHDRGGLTIAQDEATSVVYGMPKAAAKLGAADHVLPLGQIAPVLVEIVQSQYVATN
jgi:two-component system chemotaxis response regulator CheB